MNTEQNPIKIHFSFFLSVLVYNCGDYYVYGLYEYDGPCTDRMRWCTTNGGQVLISPAISALQWTQPDFDSLLLAGLY